MILNYFLLSLIVIWITDLSGVVDDLYFPLIRKVFHVDPSRIFGIKILTCSLCQTFHLGWCFLLITGNFTIPNFAFTTFISFLSPQIKSFLIWIQDFITALIHILNNIIRKFYEK